MDGARGARLDYAKGGRLRVAVAPNLEALVRTAGRDAALLAFVAPGTDAPPLVAAAVGARVVDLESGAESYRFPDHTYPLLSIADYAIEVGGRRACELRSRCAHEVCAAPGRGAPRRRERSGT